MTTFGNLSPDTRHAAAFEIEDLTRRLLALLAELLPDRGVTGEVGASIVCAVTDARSVAVFWAEQISLDEAREALGQLIDNAKGSKSTTEFVRQLDARAAADAFEADIEEFDEALAKRRSRLSRWWRKLLDILGEASSA